MSNLWLGTDEVAAMLGVAKGTVRRFMEEEGLPAYRLGRVLRFRKGEVEDWLERQRVQPGELPDGKFDE